MRKYREDYEIVYEDDGKGGEKKVARYIGNFFDIDIKGPELVKFRRNSLILLALVIMLHIAGGFIGNRGMYAFYIVLPYVFTFLPLYFLVDSAFRLPKEKRNFRRDEAELSFERMKKASIFLLIFLSMTVVGEIIYIIFFADEWNSFEFLFLSLVSLAAVASYILIRLRNTINVHEIDVQK
jgi:heme exporter protein D